LLTMSRVAARVTFGHQLLGSSGRRRLRTSSRTSLSGGSLGGSRAGPDGRRPDGRLLAGRRVAACRRLWRGAWST